MRNIFFVFIFLFFSNASSSEKVILLSKSWGNGFNIYQDSRYVGTVKKKLLHVDTIFSYVDIYGDGGKGTAKFISPGSLHRRLKKIKLYNESNITIGYIKGVVFGVGNQYNFLDRNKKKIYFANVEQDGNLIRLFDSQKGNLLAGFERVKLEKKDAWEISIFETDSVDPRFIYIFAAFAADLHWL